MTRPNRLTDEEIRTALETMPGWELHDGKLRKNWVRTNFNDAFGFLTRIALLAERMNHHPEIHNVFKRVRIELTTHDCDGISALDLALARAIDSVA
ncbi:MAG: 4a-hydroxytetrahydrobiopterin dehydratase [Candidatus Sumerlaeia bacterium]|nr:4a-hydroxytetrahydrobiopterin dehydratase [Candidatus Sumerlaeia bacterium]